FYSSRCSPSSASRPCSASPPTAASRAAGTRPCPTGTRDLLRRRAPRGASRQCWKPQRTATLDGVQPRWLDAEEQRTWRAFLGATKLLFEQLDRELQRDAGMPHAYYEILVVLSEAPRRTLRMSDLAARARSSRSRLSHAVAKLEAQGWIRRRPCPDDRRGQLAELTDAGLSV